MANLTNINNKFLVTTGGNVGIGTTSPSQKLHVEGLALIKNNTSGLLYLYDTSNSIYGDINGDAIVTAGNSLRFTVNSSERMRIDSSGGVGIGAGTIPADHRLQIHNPSFTYSRFALTNSATGSASGDGLKFQIENLNAIIKNQENGYLTFGTNGRETDLRIDSSGNVGIGTTSPVVKLAVKSSQEQLTLSEGDLRGATFDYRSSTGNLNIATNGINARTNPQFTLDLNGNVGIGTSSPGTKLDIGGMADPVLRIKSDAGGDPELRFDAAAANRSARIKFYDNGSAVGGFIDYLHNGDKMNFGAGSSTGVTMTVGDGVVGIGTTSPASVLHIKDNTAGPTQLSIQSNDFTRAEEINFLNPSTSAISGQIKYYTNPTVEYMSFSTSNNSATVERMRIDSSGNVGIGNTSPTAKLTIDNSISTSYSTTGYAATPANSMLYLNNTNGGSNTASLINFRTGSGDGVLGFVEGGGTNDADFVIQTDGGSNGIERFRITNAGNVGIGSSNADSKFKVELNPSGTVLAGLRIGYNSSSANYFDGDTQYFRNGAGTTERMRITSGGDLCVGVTTALGRIHMHNSGTSYLHISNDTTGSGAGSGTDIGVFSGQSDLQINNREAASVIISTSDTPRLTVNSSGNVGIGTTSPSTKLHIVGANGAVTPSGFSVFDLTVADNAESAIGILGNTYSSIYFGDAADPNMGAVVYNHSTNALDLRSKFSKYYL
jgi:hypothetical protein